MNRPAMSLLSFCAIVSAASLSYNYSAGNAGLCAINGCVLGIWFGAVFSPEG